MVHKITDMKKVAELFKDWDETMIWSCLQGVMGEIYVPEEPDVFDKVKLQKLVDALPEGYELKELDETVFAETKREAWCCDWTAQYPDWETYQKLGLGVVILEDGQLVSGASSYTTYESGIEIQVDTKEEYRRKGLASVCSAKLILECLERGLYPSWDAQNKGSLALAEKLGYHYSHTYTVYEVYKYRKGACA